MTQRGVLWDLDGTLVDSEQYHWQSWRDTMAAEGVTLTHEQFRATFGWRNDAILRQWLGGDVEPERAARIADAKEEAYRELVRQHGLSPLPGAADWVRSLHDGGWSQAVASSAPRANIEVVMDAIGLADQFQATAASEDVERGKPDPQVFQVAAARLGVPADRAIVVEDAPAGIQAARSAGMRCIGVRHDGLMLPADIVVRSLADLPPDAFTSLIR